MVVLFFCFFPAGNLSIVMYPSFYEFSSPSCMAVIGSHFWSGRLFGSSLCCDASCLDVCILLAGPCHWSSRVLSGFYVVAFCRPVLRYCSVGCCFRSPGRMPCPNYEAVEFQPRTVDNSALDSGCPARII